MSAVRAFLLYLSPIFAGGMIVGLIMKDQFLYAAGVAIIYLGFVFGVDKLKISKDGIEIDDEHKD